MDMLPVRRHVLRLPDDVIVVPVSYIKNGSWMCVIVGSNEASVKAGEYDIVVPKETLEAAERIIVR
jgi:hypothetical protein